MTRERLVTLFSQVWSWVSNYVTTLVCPCLQLSLAHLSVHCMTIPVETTYPLADLYHCFSKVNLLPESSPSTSLPSACPTLW